MPDSGALRSRRKRAHAAGDHYLCRPGCGGRGAVVAPPAPSGALTDPRAALERQAARLEAACEDSPGNAPLERELRATLVALSAPEDDSGFGVG